MPCILKYAFILAISTGLWCLVQQRGTLLQAKNNSHFWEIIRTESMEKYLKAKIEHSPKNAVALWKAFLWGDTHDLPLHLKRAIRELNLPHLFTPSGLHLWAIRLSGAPLELLLYYLHPTAQLIYQLMLCFFPFLFQGMWALKRMAFLHLGLLVVSRWAKKSKKRSSLFSIFLLIFSADFCFSFFSNGALPFGTFEDGPLSFTLSFLFVGSLFSSSKHQRVWPFLVGAQIFFANLQERPILAMALIVSPLLIGQFAILFPAILLSLCFPDSLIMELTLKGTHVFMREINFLFSLAIHHSSLFPWIFPSTFLAFFLPLICTKDKLAKYFALVSLLLAPNGTLNHPHADWLKIISFRQRSEMAAYRYATLTSHPHSNLTNCQAIPLENNFYIKCKGPPLTKMSTSL